VFHAIKNIEAEVFVVDNNSTDGSRQYFTNRYNNVTFIWNNKNEGFAKANNLGVKQALGEYILFLNPDTVLQEDCLEKAMHYMLSHPEAGALGIKMLDGSGKFLKESKRSFPSPATSFYKLSGLSGLFPQSKVFSKYYLGHLDKNKNHEVDVLAGAFMMIPKKIINEIGSFDEDFFMYGEDIDLSYRIQQAGYKNVYFAESSIVHFKGESTKRGSLNYVRLFYKAMSVFAQKHYGSKAKLFNFFIQVGIGARAFLSSLKRFIRWIGMPVVDGVVILISFWLVKLFWSSYIKQEVDYSPNLLGIAFPAFAFIFLLASYYSGLYDNGFKQKRLNNSTVIALLMLLSFYALLPENMRFSRGILVFGTLLAFILMSIIRIRLIKWKVIEKDKLHDEHRQTFIVGTAAEFEQVNTIMHNAGMEERVLGRVGVNTDTLNAIGIINNLNALIKTYSIREVIFCHGKLSYQQIIELVEKIPTGVRIKFHGSSTSCIIGSDSNKTSGNYIVPDKAIKLSLPVSRRNKRLTDIIVCIIFLVTIPLHFFLLKNPLAFFKNVLNVLLAKLSWVGYATFEDHLPPLKKGVLTTTGLPDVLNTLPQTSLAAADKWYATDYDIWEDFEVISKGYKFLDNKKATHNVNGYTNP